MSRRVCPTILCLFSTSAALVAAAASQAPEVPSFAKELPDVKSGDPIFQFNGKDMAGFYTYTKKHKYEDPDKVFTVHDGMIHVSGEDLGAVITGGNFSNYHLIVEWKWGDKTWAPRKDRARDSGILLHCVGPDGIASGAWMQSIECQVIEGGCGDFIMVAGKSRPRMSCEVRVGPRNQLYYEKGGMEMTRDNTHFNWWGHDPEWKDVLGYRGSREVEKPSGEWNRMEVICDGDSITNILNGYVVNVGTKSSLTEGKIIFQSEGAEIFFRKIEVRPLRK
jgi:3-keto-disaccharide hydrolase